MSKPAPSEKQCSCGGRVLRFIRSYYQKTKINRQYRLHKTFACLGCKTFFTLPYHHISHTDYKDIQNANKRKFYIPTEAEGPKLEPSDKIVSTLEKVAS